MKFRLGVSFASIGFVVLVFLVLFSNYLNFEYSGYIITAIKTVCYITIAIGFFILIFMRDRKASPGYSATDYWPSSFTDTKGKLLPGIEKVKKVLVKNVTISTNSLLISSFIIDEGQKKGTQVKVRDILRVESNGSITRYEVSCADTDTIYALFNHLELESWFAIKQ